jgi:hypothetical protein
MVAKKRIKIWKSPWHLANDYSLITALEEVADFGLLINYTRRWDNRLRSLPKNTEWVTHFSKGYDLAILNIDQQCTNENLNKAVLPVHMREAIRQIDPSCPVIWINHGTPVYPENFDDGNSSNNYISRRLRDDIKNIVGDDTMVVNSQQAVDDWGWGIPIIHGMDKSIYKPLMKEPRISTFISYAGIGDKYYNRSYLVAVMDCLWQRNGIRLNWINAPNHYQSKNFEDYIEFIGKSAVYFNPTFGSPMPRSRTEAMLCGCCIVTTPQHDADKFIKSGVNGFIVPHNNPELTANLLAKLVTSDFKVALKLGAEGRKTAINIFNVERYRNDWISLIKNICKK